MTIGENIRAVRESKGYSRTRLAKRAYISPMTIQMWETDKYVPTVSLLIAVADILGVTLDELVGRKVQK